MCVSPKRRGLLSVWIARLVLCFVRPLTGYTHRIVVLLGAHLLTNGLLMWLGEMRFMRC
jgi:hypothetical protein